MTSERTIYRRVLRRETHSSRTSAAVVAASVAIAILAAGVIGGVWGLLDPRVVGEARVWFDEAIPVGNRAAASVAAGVIALLLALVLIALAVGPGRRARRARTTERVALLVDDGVLADAVADAVALRCGIDRRQVATTLGRSSVTVRITPTSGIRVDDDAAAAAASSTMTALGFTATPRVRVESGGVVA
jgi:hypothetical protein